MTNLYEYKHPIINKYLADGSDDGSGKKFATLNDWYNVINDYEFQSRCPIILKNSHKNKHFTFACHLKDCKFKILLSYCSGLGPTADDDDHRPDDKRDVVNAPRTEDDVSAAIAAAVAAVNDSGDTEKGSKVEEPFAEDSACDLGAMDDLKNGRVEGPFMVTKIEPYHNHPLESNLSLGKFVLTKIPRILQHDLNFDQVLRDLCNEEDNTIAKFKVSQYVEESGIQDILRERYGLTDEDLDKKLISQISRRVTTYKARFVLKKKKNGEYGVPGAADGDDGLNGTESPGSTRTARYNRTAAINDSSNLSSLEQDSQLQKALTQVQEAQAAAQAAMGDQKRPLSMVEQEISVDQLAKKQRGRPLNSLIAEDGSLVALEDTGDDKLPHEVAEQLRLLSSHFKEVENEEKVKSEIPDENIQPELRGQ